MSDDAVTQEQADREAAEANRIRNRKAFEAPRAAPPAPETPAPEKKRKK